MTFPPVAVEPVNATLATSGWLVSASRCVRITVMNTD